MDEIDALEKETKHEYWKLGIAFLSQSMTDSEYQDKYAEIMRNRTY